MTLAWLTDTVTPDLDRALHYTLLWGLEGIELRSMGGLQDRVPFVNEEKLRRRLEEHELPVVAVVPGMFEGPYSDRVSWLDEVARLDQTLQFCRRIGCPRVVVSSFAGGEHVEVDEAAGALRRAGERAGEAGITLAVLNEAVGAFPTGRRLADLLEAVDHPAVRAAWSPAHAVCHGEPAGDGLRALSGCIELVRCRDGRVVDGAWEEEPLGEGAVDWEEQLKILQDQGFDGPISLEVYLDPKPKQGLRMSSALISLMRATRRT